MGAVFAIFGGFYYWFNRMTGMTYNERLGQYHFWLFFIGVNITFFPMHFLGLAGMPRRISDYPDAFAGWNSIASLGSCISIIATFLFAYIIYEGLTNDRGVTNFAWRDIEVTRYAMSNRGAFLFLDAPVPNQLSFQDPATRLMEGIINFHHDLMFYIIVISVLVLYMLLRIVYVFGYENPTYAQFVGDNSKYYRSLTHNMLLEVIWTAIPSVILINIAGPSLGLLYASEEIHIPEITVKIIGNQWYWSYEISHVVTQTIELPDEFKLVGDVKDLYPFFDMATGGKTLQVTTSETDINGMHRVFEVDALHSVKFDSVMKQTDDMKLGGLRNLTVDNPLVLPINTPIKLIITSNDVIHSWAIPSFGIKVDAIPGRLNTVDLTIMRTGFFTGQCSELCGTNHGFMPINVIAVTNMDVWTQWLLTHQDFVEIPANK